MIAENVHQTITAWVNEYSDTFYQYLHHRLRDPSAAKDILQETFIAAWKNLESFKREADEKTWLFAILKNKLIDHYRSHSRTLTEPGPTQHFFDQEDHWTKTAAPKSWNDAEDALNRKEFYMVLEACTKKLTPAQQLVFTMKYIDDHETGFICKVLQITSSNYWVIIHRCKLQLRACLEMNWFLKER